MSNAGFQKLLTWLSPAFPVGAFAWSAGLETAIADQRVTDSAATQSWIEGILAHGGMHTDAIILAHAHRAASDAVALSNLAEFCLALTGAAERREELLATGAAFILAASAWGNLPLLPAKTPYPVAVGAIAAAHAIPRAETVLAFLTAAVHAQVSVAVRLVPIGQTAGLSIVAALEGQIAEIAAAAADAPREAIGGIGYAAEIAQMRHELLEPRIFRS